MMDYLAELDRRSDVFEISSIGKSVQGRDLPALFFTLDETFGSRRGEKPIVFLYCQQHGNEPSGKEAALIMARTLAGNGKALLDDMDVIIVPQVNPDGNEANTRLNAHEQNLNRSYAVLNQPESLAMHQLFLKWMPEVAADLHEFNCSSKSWFKEGYIKDVDIMMDGVSNLNIAPEIMALSSEVIVPEVGAYVEDAGYSFHRYVVGGPPESRRIRHSTMNINDGRQSIGIYNTFSFIFEGKRYDDVTSNIKDRVLSYVAALDGFLKTVGRHREEILKITRAARASHSKLSHIKIDYVPDPNRPTLDLPIFNLNNWKSEVRTLGNYEPLGKVTQSVEKPFAYAVPQDEHRLIELLLRHQLKMARLTVPAEVEVEEYTILKVEDIIDEDKSGYKVTVEADSLLKILPAGSVIIPLQQPASNLIPLLLEPQSSFGICTERSGLEMRFGQYLQVGSAYPVLRIVKQVELEMDESL